MDWAESVGFEPYQYTCQKVEDFRRYQVELGSLATPSGPSPYTIVRMKPFACALAVVPGDEPRIVLARQFRYAPGSWELELPAGGVEAGETPVEAALRELREETGLLPDEAVDLGMVYPSGGSTDEVAHLVAVRCAAGRVAPDFDPGEQVEMLLVSRDEFEQLMANGDFRHAVGYAAWVRFCARGLDGAWL